MMHAHTCQPRHRRARVAPAPATRRTIGHRHTHTHGPGDTCRPVLDGTGHRAFLRRTPRPSLR
eukprot:5440029-Prymnesium_polylepis.1